MSDGASFMGAGLKIAPVVKGIETARKSLHGLLSPRLKIAPVVKGIETYVVFSYLPPLVRLKIAPVVKGIETNLRGLIAVSVHAIENCPGS